jgi:hypothetical protein
MRMTMMQFIDDTILAGGGRRAAVGSQAPGADR